CVREKGLVVGSSFSTRVLSRELSAGPRAQHEIEGGDGISRVKLLFFLLLFCGGISGNGLGHLLRRAFLHETFPKQCKPNTHSRPPRTRETRRRPRLKKV